jgi:hypothetical protein
MTSMFNDKKVPLWSEAESGFGYSGVLIHPFDVPVYELLHSTFFRRESLRSTENEVICQVWGSEKDCE